MKHLMVESITELMIAITGHKNKGSKSELLFYPYFFQVYNIMIFYIDCKTHLYYMYFEYIILLLLYKLLLYELTF